MKSQIRQIQFVAPASVVWAQNSGFFNKVSLSVLESHTKSSSEIGSGLARGEWDIGICVMDNVIGWNDLYDSDLIMLAQVERITELSFVGAAGVHTLEGAMAKPISVDATTNGFVLVLYRALAKIGVDWRTCEFLEVGGVKQRFDSLLAGQTHSTILVPPFDLMAIEKGYNVLWQGSEVAPHYPGQVVVARRRWATENREIVVKYLQALLAATRWALLLENRESAKQVLLSAGYSEAEAMRKFQLASPELEVLSQGWEEVVNLRKESGLLPQPKPNLKDVSDQSFRIEALKLV